ncbi:MULTISPECIES: hypothetical protein [Paenibacillus]|uniref:hypothetical protein n=1 Tax=Paenibacillus TaxID=44249 RepID=UPI0022B9182E|nr:hypothetical protein [Paenibacillus caseinilyticus]MCZ8520970.1 hypothetical protein [Paenibacillus caseinilyticus]
MHWSKMAWLSMVVYFFLYGPLWIYIVTDRFHPAVTVVCLVIGLFLMLRRNYVTFKDMISHPFTAVEILLAAALNVLIFSPVVPSRMKAAIFVISLLLYVPTFFKLLDISQKKQRS